MKIIKGENGENLVALSTKEAEAAVVIAAGIPSLLEENEQAEKKAADASVAVTKAIPPVVDTLAKGGYITNDQRAKAAESLKDPVKVLGTLQRIALSTAIKSAEAKPLGSASTPTKDTKPAVKQASIGAPQSEADQKFLRDFGLA